MSAPAPSPNPTAADPRLQAKLGNVNKTNATVVSGKKGERSIIDDKIMTSETHTLYIGNCEDCDFIITAACTKVLVESCRKSRITLNGRIKTNVFEIWKCEDVTILINTHIFTIQADLCKKLSVEFTKKELYNQLVWGGVHDLKLTFQSILETGYAQMKEKHADISLSDQTDQFIVRFVQGKLLQELIVRLKNGYPTTEREAAIFDENQRKKDEHMRREAEKLIKFVPKKFLKGDEPKVGRNEPCPCNSGKKYKACCGVAKKEEAKPAAEAQKSDAAANDVAATPTPATDAAAVTTPAVKP